MYLYTVSDNMVDAGEFIWDTYMLIHLLYGVKCIYVQFVWDVLAQIQVT